MTKTFLIKEVNYNSIEVEADYKDYPDFCDTFAIFAEYVDGTELTDEALEELTENSDLMHEKANEKFF